MEIFIGIVLLGLGLLGYFFFKGFSNTRFTANENEFTQGGVVVNFKNKTINIKGNLYNVNQITGMRTKAFSSERRGDSKAKNVIIEIDDFKRPTHKILFITSGQAEKFMQRLSTALRKAGGPNFK